MNSRTVATMLGIAVGVIGCAGGEIERFTIGEKGVDAKVRTEMQAVMPHVTKGHLAECRTRLEKISWLGARYEIIGELASDKLLSCIAQMPSNPLFASATAKRMVLAAQMRKVAGVYGTGMAQELGVCVLEMQDGKVRIAGVTRAPRAHATHVCLQI